MVLLKTLSSVYGQLYPGTTVNWIPIIDILETCYICNVHLPLQRVYLLPWIREIPLLISPTPFCQEQVCLMLSMFFPLSSLTCFSTNQGSRQQGGQSSPPLPSEAPAACWGSKYELHSPRKQS